MSNLLALNPLTTANELAEVYVVYDRKDYRMSLSTLLALVTKSSVGLSRVDNTSDAEKPLSMAAIEALGLKADANAVPSMVAFNALSNSLQNYVTLDALNGSIQSIVDSLNNYATKSEVNDAITAALSPITSSISQIVTSLQSHAARLSALEQGEQNDITRTVLEEELGLLRTDILGQFQSYSDQNDLTLTSIASQIASINQTLNAVTVSLDQKADVNHRHDPSEINNLTEFVQNIVTQDGGQVSVGPDEW